MYYHHVFILVTKLTKLLIADRAKEGFIPCMLPKMIPQMATLVELHIAVVEEALKLFDPPFFRFLHLIDSIFGARHPIKINRSLGVLVRGIRD